MADGLGRDTEKKEDRKKSNKITQNEHGQNVEAKENKENYKKIENQKEGEDTTPLVERAIYDDYPEQEYAPKYEKSWGEDEKC